MATETKKEQQIKVTDKRIFTAEGDIKEEFRNEVKPVEPVAAKAPEKEPEPAAAEKKAAPQQEERRRTMQDKAQNPGTAFTEFIEPLIAQAYMSLGLLRNPYQQKPALDVAAARQMIEIITMLKEKTEGNLTPDEEDFLGTHLGELKLAYVQRTKTI